MSNLFRIYEPHELGEDGYPRAWHAVEGDDELGGVKHRVREQAGHRCVRCGHPYVVGESGVMEGNAESHCLPMRDYELLRLDGDDGFPEPMVGGSDSVKGGARVHWSACDEHCTHGGPVRFPDSEETPTTAYTSDPPVGTSVADGWRVEAAWRILTVHHLNERKHDLRWWNLAALCQRCHLYIQRKVQMERVYPWEHSDWFKPHAAGWYSYAYHGEDLTREQTMERLDELLALECVA